MPFCPRIRPPQFGSIAEEMDHAPIETLETMFNEVFDHVKITDTIERKDRERLVHQKEMLEQRQQGDQEGRKEQQRPTEQGISTGRAIYNG